MTREREPEPALTAEEVIDTLARTASLLRNVATVARVRPDLRQGIKFTDRGIPYFDDSILVQATLVCIAEGLTHPLSFGDAIDAVAARRAESTSTPEK
jgi:hypothetical protein